MSCVDPAREEVVHLPITPYGTILYYFICLPNLLIKADGFNWRTGHCNGAVAVSEADGL